jgi:hypothetical protein
MDIVRQLREQAQEIAHEGHNGWGNTMLIAANEIERLQATQQSAQVTGLCPFCGDPIATEHAHEFCYPQEPPRAK